MNTRVYWVHVSGAHFADDGSYQVLATDPKNAKAEAKKLRVKDGACRSGDVYWVESL